MVALRGPVPHGVLARFQRRSMLVSNLGWVVWLFQLLGSQLQLGLRSSPHAKRGKQLKENRVKFVVCGGGAKGHSQYFALRLPRAVHPLKVFFTFNAHLEFSYFSY
jgi:hypothetical protein